MPLKWIKVDWPARASAIACGSIASRSRMCRTVRLVSCGIETSLVSTRDYFHLVSWVLSHWNAGRFCWNCPDLVDSLCCLFVKAWRVWKVVLKLFYLNNRWDFPSCKSKLLPNPLFGKFLCYFAAWIVSVRVVKRWLCRQFKWKIKLYNIIIRYTNEKKKQK